MQTSHSSSAKAYPQAFRQQQSALFRHTTIARRIRANGYIEVRMPPKAETKRRESIIEFKPSRDLEHSRAMLRKRNGHSGWMAMGRCTSNEHIPLPVAESRQPRTGNRTHNSQPTSSQAPKQYPPRGSEPRTIAATKTIIIAYREDTTYMACEPPNTFLLTFDRLHS
ncbi:hypothetical protein EJ03DRAFT_206659 [Teratosphaeria nubilosa]|uniref:Uncharacterized protein n=1 Tax=Teratosphaeria nubilosa TaxID=161662 RepID=A0A6G1KY12_9PEZI|nr:hypothetical protein EJ03DRAFT_206659 [Teratosphaeria nubilosa]